MITSCKSISYRFHEVFSKVSPKTLKARSKQIHFSSTNAPRSATSGRADTISTCRLEPFHLGCAISVKIFIEPPATATLDGFMMMTLLTAIVSIIRNEFVDVCTFVLIKLFKLPRFASCSARFTLETYMIAHKLKAFPHLTSPVLLGGAKNFSTSTFYFFAQW